MPDWITIAKVGEVSSDKGCAVSVGGSKMVALFLREGTYYAMHDFCPHQGAPLSEGFLDGDKVICPWHLWQFCVRDGRWLDSPKSSLKVETYPVRVLGDEIQVQLPADPA